MEQQHVASVNVTANPIAPLLGAPRNITSLASSRLQSESMRTIQNSQRTLRHRAIMKRYPGGEALLISCHSGVVLVGLNDATLEIREDKPGFRLWMYQKLFPDEQLHHRLQQAMMWERVKGLETKDFVTNNFVAWIIVSTCGVDTANPFDRIAV
jgi:hypothetical protein